jgi:NADPH-dependent glutamate synthase beta subunit-like oxidoreductase
MTADWQLELGFGFSYADLHTIAGLRRLYQAWERFFATTDPEGYQRFEQLRQGAELPPPVQSSYLIDAAKALERFLVTLFGIETEHAELERNLLRERRITALRSEFLKRAALRHKQLDTSPEHWQKLSSAYAEVQRRFARLDWQDEEAALAELIDQLQQTAASAGSTDGISPDQATALLALLEEYLLVRRAIAPESMAGWLTSWTPRKLDPDSLVTANRTSDGSIQRWQGAHYRARDGFALTDTRPPLRTVVGQTDYCMICHQRQKDSCSKGFREPNGGYKRNPLGVRLTGCPLDEHISEMHHLTGAGHLVAALSMVMINNPLCAGTGHRICNDCMKGCIFQKQEPVNTPLVETTVLERVLSLPWGVEIYDLLTRWNPLRLERPYPVPYNGRKVLVVGMGPAGYTLALYLLNEGFGVVGIDGLKIEPLPAEWVGSESTPPVPIRQWHDITEPLDRRIPRGFGGVSEYGITVRWEKNFLTLLQLILERRRTFCLLDGIRFGGTITLEDAWERGFDHVALCTGAGRPTIISVENNLARGVRKASDFLMSLQLTGAAQHQTLANLQLRLPAIVIGGGLTGIDTATEALAYYPVQVERFYRRAQELIATGGSEAFWSQFRDDDRTIAEEFFEHGRAIARERERAAAAGRQPNFLPLLRQWGGVQLVYRKRWHDSPAYRLNHEEIEHALEEGIELVECLDPRRFVLDQHRHIRAVVFERIDWDGSRYTPSGELVELPARSVLIAAGTQPNITYEREYPGTFELDAEGRYYRAYVAEIIDPTTEAEQSAAEPAVPAEELAQ